MKLKKIAAACGLAIAAVTGAQAQVSGDVIKIGLITDMSSVYADIDGQGGVAGFGKGSADVVLMPEGAATRLNYAASAQVGGKMAQVGSRRIDAAAGLER